MCIFNRSSVFHRPDKAVYVGFRFQCLSMRTKTGKSPMYIYKGTKDGNIATVRTESMNPIYIILIIYSRINLLVDSGFTIGHKTSDTSILNEIT